MSLMKSDTKLEICSIMLCTLDTELNTDIGAIWIVLISCIQVWQNNSLCCEYTKDFRSREGYHMRQSFPRFTI